MIPSFPQGFRKQRLLWQKALAGTLFPSGKRRGLVTVWIWSGRRGGEKLAKFKVKSIGEENSDNAHRTRLGGRKRGRAQGTAHLRGRMSWGGWEMLPKSGQLTGLRMNERSLVGTLTLTWSRASPKSFFPSPLSKAAQGCFEREGADLPKM